MIDLAGQRAFVGRAGELTRLHAALRRAVDGGGTTAVIDGEAGIGKSRLVEEFAGQAQAAGARVLAGACLEFGEGGVPYAPFVEALRALVRSTEPGRLPALLGPGRSELGRLVPEVAARGPDPVIHADLDRSAAGRLFEFVLGVLERLGRSDPVVLIVEDVHWSDASTRDLLGFLARNLRRSRVLLVVTVRSEELHRRASVLAFLAELLRSEHVQHIELRPFERRELAEQIETIVGSPPEPGLVDRVLARADGNPFYAEQLLAAETAAYPGEIPARLRDVLVARVTALSTRGQEVLRAAAAAGRRIDDRLLSAALELPERELHDALREALAHEILVRIPRSGGEAAYAFRHALLHEVVYAELFTGERIRLHGAFARALAERAAAGEEAVAPAELAYHWDAAREPARALTAMVEAGHAAERVYAYADASRFYERALELWDRVPETERLVEGERTALLQRAADASVLVGRYDRAIELGRAALAAVDAADDPLRAGVLHERLRWYLWEAGDREAAAAAVEDALRLIPPDPPTLLRARALAHAAGLRLYGGEHVVAVDLASQALATAEAASAGPTPEKALALGVLGWSRSALGDVDEGIATFSQGLGIAVDLGGVEGIALAHTNLSSLLDRVGRTEESLAAAREGFAVAERYGVERTYGGILLGHAGKALFNIGRWSEASTVLDQGLDLDPVGRPAVWLRINKARLDANQGRFAEAGEHLRRAREIDEELGGTEYRGPLLAGIAELAVLEGRLSDVRAAAIEGARRARADEPPDPALAWLAAVALGAEADAAEGARARRDEAGLAEAQMHASAIGEHLARFEASGLVRTEGGGRARALAALCRAELSRLGRTARDATWDAVATAWDEIGRPYPAAYARFRLVEAILAERGPRIAASDALRAAHRVVAALGAEPLRREIELLARQARIDLDPADATADDIVAAEVSPLASYALTEREEEVLRLVAGGWSNQQIADALFITRKTASVHVSNILGKLAVATRVEAAAVAHRLGLAADAPAPPGR